MCGLSDENISVSSSATWVDSGLAANSSFAMRGAGVDRDTAICGVGLSSFVADSAKVCLDYNAHVGAKGLSRKINAGICWQFWGANVYICCLFLFLAVRNVNPGMFMRFLWHIRKN